MISIMIILRFSFIGNDLREKSKEEKQFSSNVIK